MKCAPLLVGALSLLAVALAPAVAFAEPAVERDYQHHFQATVGLRTSWVSHLGFDPYSKSDDMTQFSLGLARTVVAFDRLSIVGAATWEVGGAGATARGMTTDLVVHRIALGPELRYHVHPRLYGFVAVLPGAQRSGFELRDDAVGADLHDVMWNFSTDATAGAAVQVIGSPGRARVRPMLWVRVEGGYGYATEKTPLLLPREDSNAPERVEAVDMGRYAFRGGLMRLTLAVTL